jgi:hypothetical protein
VRGGIHCNRYCSADHEEELPQRHGSPPTREQRRANPRETTDPVEQRGFHVPDVPAAAQMLRERLNCATDRRRQENGVQQLPPLQDISCLHSASLVPSSIWLVTNFQSRRKGRKEGDRKEEDGKRRTARLWDAILAVGATLPPNSPRLSPVPTAAQHSTMGGCWQN